MSYGVNAVACVLDWVVASIRGNDALNNLVGGRISGFPSPSEMVYPAIAYSAFGSKAHIVTGNVIVDMSVSFNLIAVDKGYDISSVMPISALLHTIFHDEFNATVRDRGSLGKILSCRVIDNVYYSEEDDEKTVWQYLGHTYEVIMQ